MGAPALQPTSALRSMSFKVVNGLMYVRHRDQAVKDEDWQALLAEMGRAVQGGGTLKILVRTDSAGPNVVQRSALNSVVAAAGGTIRVAVLSSSVIVRGIITAFSWMRTVQIRSFSPSQYGPALSYLEVKATPEAAERVIGEIERLVA